MPRIAHLACGLLLALPAASAACALAAEASRSSVAPAVIDDVLTAEDAGLVGVRFIPNDSRSAQVVVANRGAKPLTLRLPAAFGAVPVLAQMGMGGGMGIGGGMGMCWVAREVYGVHDPRWILFRDWMEHDAPLALQCGYAMHGEDLSDWLRTRPLAKQVTRSLLDQAIAGREVEADAGAHLSVSAAAAPASFVVYPGKSRVVRVPTVCLEHGKREPNAKVPYRMVRLDACTSDPRVAEILESLSRGMVSQKVAQAVSWHLSSGRTWEQLAAEVIEMAGGADPDVPVFSPLELAMAKRFVDAATSRHPVESVSSASSPGQ